VKILIASEAEWIRDQVRAAFVAPGQGVIEVTRGRDVGATVAAEDPDLVILDMQIGNMGGVAVAIELHLDAEEGRVPDVPIILLLDREADRFLSKRAAADEVLVKPLDAGTLRRAAKRIIAATTLGATPSGAGPALR
jgi:DNA-binding response OmpR family regulator